MKGNESAYGNFAYYYDSLMDEIDYKSWRNYITEILERYEIKYRDLLEMACGTGTMSVMLACDGYSVTAFDLSCDMLCIANQKAVDKGVDINFLNQDMCDIRINADYGIILCLCDSINYITDSKKLSDVFQWVFNHLKDGGIFIFDINSSYKLKNIIGDNTFTDDKDDIVYIWNNVLTEDGTVEFYLTFFVKQGNNYKRFDEFHVEKIYESGEILDMLRYTGFNEIYVKDGMTMNEVNPFTERINFIVLKR